MFWFREIDQWELGFQTSDEPTVIEHRIAHANGLEYGCPPRHWNWGS